jgi:hypothetical protein
MTRDEPRLDWAEIEREKTALIDQVILAPVIWRNSEGRQQADGVLREFKIIAGTGNTDKGQTVTEFGLQDQLLPRTALHVIPLDPIRAY